MVLFQPLQGFVQVEQPVVSVAADQIDMRKLQTLPRAPGFFENFLSGGQRDSFDCSRRWSQARAKHQ